MIHRVDLARIARAASLGNDEPTQEALRQVGWTAIGIVFFVGVLVLVPDHRTLARYGYTAGFVGLVLLALPAVLPASLSEVNGARIWIRLGPRQHPARRVREDPVRRSSSRRSSW